MKKMIILLILLSFQAWSQSDCGFSINFSNVTAAGLTSDQNLNQTITLNRSLLSPLLNCIDYRFYFGKGNANSYSRMAFNTQGESLNYNLFSTANQSGLLKDYNDATSTSEYLSGSALLRLTNYNETFYVYLPAITTSNFKRAGTYTDIVPINIYNIKLGGQPNFQKVQNLTLSFVIPQFLHLSIVPEGGTFDVNATALTMDFGSLDLNKELGADLRVVSNTSYQVKLSSQNNGNLKNTSLNSLVSYQLKVGSNTINLTNSATTPVSVASGSLVTSSAGDRYNIKVKITETNLRPAGAYQDLITITTIAN